MAAAASDARKTPTRSPSASWPATAVPSRARSRWRRTSTPARAALLELLYPHAGKARTLGITGPPGVGKSSLIAALCTLLRDARPDGRRDHRRPLQPHHAWRAAGRPHPARRALPRPRRLHPLDGDARAPRRRRRGDAAGGRDRGRVGPRRACSTRRSAWGRARSRSPALADTVALVLMPGSGDSIQALKAGRHGDPRRDRRQQGRSPGHRAHARRARAGALAGRSRAPPGRDRDRRHGVDRHRRAVGTRSRRTSAHSPTAATWPSAARPSCAPSCSRSPRRASARRLGELLDRSPELAGLVDALAERRIDPLTAVQQLLERA